MYKIINDNSRDALILESELYEQLSKCACCASGAPSYLEFLPQFFPLFDVSQLWV